MSAQELNTVLLKGKLMKQRQHNGKFYTRIATPAPDAYSMPSQFTVRSSQPIGAIDSEVQGKVVLSGFVRDRQYTDRQTGEIKNAEDATVIFDWVS